MSRRTNTPKVELKLELSPPRSADQQVIVSPNTSVSSSPGSSCVSSEPTDDSTTVMPYPSSPEGMSMVLVGCPRCLICILS
ncbi:nuclear speckle splicing regulatory protein 1 [Gossypium australe]|uniref:Nuclear speckle splicing regulatory protein 1 n=1 Tax=Gossypium australe TaxID=47621 RepID=A0A5B6X9A1_9ROSI|nr:nuclear speckle splicing regulatory protein 1 [Gossypium australe]